jgi:hypothetical protein
LLGDVILKDRINFTGKDGTLSAEEAAAVVVVVVVGVGVVISVVVVEVVVLEDATAILHKVWDGLSKRFVKLSLLNFPWPAAV